MCHGQQGPYCCTSVAAGPVTGEPSVVRTVAVAESSAVAIAATASAAVEQGGWGLTPRSLPAVASADTAKVAAQVVGTVCPGKLELGMEQFPVDWLAGGGALG